MLYKQRSFTFAAGFALAAKATLGKYFLSPTLALAAVDEGFWELDQPDRKARDRGDVMPRWGRRDRLQSSARCGRVKFWVGGSIKWQIRFGAFV